MTIESTHIATGSWDGVHFPLTEEFIEAVKSLMAAEIKMMRKVHKDTPECWYCGAAKIGDMAGSSYLTFTFGGKEEADYMAVDADIFVTVDFSPSKA